MSFLRELLERRATRWLQPLRRDVAGSLSTPRSPDTDTEAKIGGLMLCFFGITVLGFGIGLFASKTAPLSSASRHING
ncbi:hypothetical protein ACFXNW_29470 [Nocardia sp. NPDC059180]|uniref:hypothetical protein n=1 Tax=Nocardia sp. NPDC059180 TaxID=3346761 RepID=UPI0036BD2E7F